MNTDSSTYCNINNTSSDYSCSPASCSPAKSNYNSDMNDSSNPYNMMGSPLSNFSDGSSHVDDITFWQQPQQQIQQQQQQQPLCSAVSSSCIQPASFINCTTTMQQSMMVSEVTEISNLSSITPTFCLPGTSNISKDMTLYLTDV